MSNTLKIATNTLTCFRDELQKTKRKADTEIFYDYCSAKELLFVLSDNPAV